MDNENTDGHSGLRNFFEDAVRWHNGHFVHQWDAEMGEVTSPCCPLFSHPRKDGETVVAEYGGGKVVFDIGFVKECFDASKDGGNELVRFLSRFYSFA